MRIITKAKEIKIYCFVIHCNRENSVVFKRTRECNDIAILVVQRMPTVTGTPLGFVGSNPTALCLESNDKELAIVNHSVQVSLYGSKTNKTNISDSVNRDVNTLKRH